jgi:16S rRNA processing protein RimM
LNNDKIEWLLIGRVVDTHGMNGALKIKCGEVDLDLFEDLKKVRLCIKGSETEHTVLSMKTDKKILLLNLDSITDRTAAEAVIGGDVSCRRSETAKLQSDQWWIRDLIGMQAFKTSGEYIGTISDVSSFTGNTVLEIKSADTQRKDPFLIPFVDALVPKVDIAERRVEIVDLPGLLE